MSESSSALLIVGSVIATAVLVTGSAALEALLTAIGVGAVAFLIGDLVPRRVGRVNERAIAYRSAGLLAVAMKLGGWANELLPELDEEIGDGSEEETDEADEHERELIDSVLEFTETVVREVMTPRPDMITISEDAPIEKLIGIATDEGYSRVPVVNGEDVIGQVIIKDLLPMLNDDRRPSTVIEVMRPVEFVPETKLASALLAEMQESHTHQVIVVDEYGDVAGLVTIEDLLEELVGEIADETDFEETLVAPATEGWDVDARLGVQDLVKLTDVQLPDGEWDTVGGLVLGLAERVPEEGEQFRAGQLVMRVTKMQGRRISEVNVVVVDQIEAV
jgi:CBS domain containing-hemolysin-like protein